MTTTKEDRSLSDLDQNKDTVTSFLQTAFVAGRPQEAVERYVGASYRQHSPTAADGIDAFLAFAGGLTQERPNIGLDIKRVLADGDLVAVHMHVTGVHEGDERGDAVIDIFRLDGDGRIVEHWDVMQPVPESSPNPNGMF
jgi:predicted SnoaL-like aldol condensation-catalyzing enzyme